MNSDPCRSTNGSAKSSLKTGTNDGSAAATHSKAAAATDTRLNTARQATRASFVKDRNLASARASAIRCFGLLCERAFAPRPSAVVFGPVRPGNSIGAAERGLPESRHGRGLPRPCRAPRSGRFLLRLRDPDSAAGALDQYPGRPFARPHALAAPRRCARGETALGANHPGLLGAARGP